MSPWSFGRNVSTPPGRTGVDGPITRRVRAIAPARLNACRLGVTRVGVIPRDVEIVVEDLTVSGFPATSENVNAGNPLDWNNPDILETGVPYGPEPGTYVQGVGLINTLRCYPSGTIPLGCDVVGVQVDMVTDSTFDATMKMRLFYGIGFAIGSTARTVIFPTGEQKQVTVGGPEDPWNTTGQLTEERARSLYVSVWSTEALGIDVIIRSMTIFLFLRRTTVYDPSWKENPSPPEYGTDYAGTRVIE